MKKGQSYEVIEKNYYEKELNKIDLLGHYASTIKLRGNNNETKWMDINKKSAIALIEKLQKVVDFYDNLQNKAVGIKKGK